MNPDALFRESFGLFGDPERAEPEWEALKPHVSEAALATDGLRFLFALLGNSRFLVHRLIHAHDPSAAIDALVLSPHLLKPKSAAQMVQELAVEESLEDPISTQRLLRAHKYRELTRIAARDLSGLVPFEEIGRELAAVAESSAQIAVRAAGAAKDPFVILAMGKFGGEDLNFSSDIDLLYVHGPSHGAETRDRSVLERFGRVSETVTRLLQEKTGDGFVFRVDLDLRPEGKSGVIVNSLEALTAYYEVSGAPWERAALTKARPVAGDIRLGLRALAQLEPFIFPRLIGSTAIDDLKSIKAKINAELKKYQKSKPGGFHVKLGIGGIREIEFFVAAFQLIYGGKESALRERHTLTALRRLGELGLVPGEDVSRLEDAYIFLRRIENRLQMEEERQTHRLPTHAADLKALARRMGFHDTADFEGALREKTAFVASCFERLAS